jgi:hypothetical protein
MLNRTSPEYLVRDLITRYHGTPSGISPLIHGIEIRLIECFSFGVGIVFLVLPATPSVVVKVFL